MLAVAVRFLTGRYYASDFRDRSMPEWAPHPDRLFSALVATYHAGTVDPGERAALLWLEQQQPPALAVPLDVVPRSMHAMVPINDPYSDAKMTRLNDRVLPGIRGIYGRRPRDLPSVHVPGGQMHFIWMEAEPPQEIREDLVKLLSRVSRLGSAASLVDLQVVHDPPPVTLSPDPSGTESLRVPSLGRLDDLETRKASPVRTRVP